jgi:hypothetical protein
MAKIIIDTDGTKNGTVLTVDGEEIKFQSINFGCESWNSEAWFTYTVLKEDADKKMQVRTTFTYDPSIAKLTAKQEVVTDDQINLDDFQRM